MSDTVHWHDAECGRYVMDLPLWRALAAEAAGPVLDVGAGTGRVALDLARAGHEVTALDLEPELLIALAERARAAGLPVRTVAADARALGEAALGGPFALVLAPMQTVQLLGGHAGRMRFLRGALAVLRPGGRLAVALADDLETFEGELPADLAWAGAVTYASHPVAVLEQDAGWLLVRRRDRIVDGGATETEHHELVLDRVGAGKLVAEGLAAGFAADTEFLIPATVEHAGSQVVVLRAP